MRRMLAAMAQNGTANPMVTGPDGTYGFALLPSQIATGGSVFYLNLNAPGYLNRKIELDITPGVQGQLYNVHAIARDGQPLAAAGGYALTNNSIELSDVFGLFGNLPLFEANPISVSKTADRQAAEPGDRIVYTIAFSNVSSMNLTQPSISDTLPAGLVYAPGTSRRDGNAVEPQVNGQTLTWTIPSFPPGSAHTISYATIVYPSVAAGTTLTNTVQVGALATGGMKETGSSGVSVIVTDGMFSERRLVTGRVFADMRGTGHFARGDQGIAGVRIYLEDGSFAVTDSNGFFSFPSVRPGMHALRLDATTLPTGVRLFRDVPANSTRAPQRLLHGVLDLSTMEDVEFAVQGGAP
jgi:uncharacterized repeat protein (TIGR01451 family)